MTDAVQVARGMLVARVEHSFECDSESIMQGSCDCDREALVDAYRAALLADVRERVAGMTHQHHESSCDGDDGCAACYGNANISRVSAMLGSIIKEE